MRGRSHQGLTLAFPRELQAWSSAQPQVPVSRCDCWSAVGSTPAACRRSEQQHWCTSLVSQALHSQLCGCQRFMWLRRSWRLVGDGYGRWPRTTQL